jgi:hypothetical protein
LAGVILRACRSHPNAPGSFRGSASTCSLRDVLAVPWGKDWPIVKRELARCAEVRRAMIQAGWFH